MDWVLIAMFAAPVAFWWCCCAKCGQGCLNCNARTSNDMQVTITGFAANSPPTFHDCLPADCPYFNGTFILQSGCCISRWCGPQDCCEWEVFTGFGGCKRYEAFAAMAMMRFRIFKEGSNYKSQIIPTSTQDAVTGCFDDAVFTLDHGTAKPNCNGFSSTNHPLDPSFVAVYCDVSAATAEVTSVP